jgi:hypothetical protein
MRRDALRFAGLLLLLANLVVVSEVQAGEKKKRCYRDWSKAGQVVRKNKLAHVDELSQAAVQAGLGQIMKVELCRNRRGFEYRLILRDAFGRFHRKVTGAREPFPKRRQKKRSHRKK